VAGVGEGSLRTLTGSHVACYMLRTSKSCVANGAFVIASHLEKRKGEREMVVG